MLTSCNKSAEQQAVQVEAAKTPKPALPAGSTEFKSPNGSFSIYMPGKPEESTQTVPETDGVSGKMHMYTVASDKMVFLVEDMLVSKDVEHSGSTDEMLKGVETGFSGSSGTKVVHSNNEQILGYPGRRMEFSNTQMTFKGFSLLAKKHNFIVVAGGLNANIDDAKAKTFFDSFRVENDMAE